MGDVQGVIIHYFRSFSQTEAVANYLLQQPPLSPASNPDTLNKVIKYYRLTFSSYSEGIPSFVDKGCIVLSGLEVIRLAGSLISTRNTEYIQSVYMFCLDYLHILRLLCHVTDCATEHVASLGQATSDLLAKVVGQIVSCNAQKLIIDTVHNAIKRECELASDIICRPESQQRLSIVKAVYFILLLSGRLACTICPIGGRDFSEVSERTPGFGAIERLTRGILFFLGRPGVSDLLRGLCREVAQPNSQMAEHLPSDFIISVGHMAIAGLVVGIHSSMEYSDMVYNALSILEDVTNIYAGVRKVDHAEALARLSSGGVITLGRLEVGTLEMALQLQRTGSVKGLAPLLGKWCAMRDGDSEYGRCEAARALLGLIGLSSQASEKVRQRMQDEFSASYDSSSVDATAASLTALSPTKHLPQPQAPYSFLVPTSVLIESCKNLFKAPPESPHDRFLRTCLPFARLITGAIINVSLWDANPPYSLRDGLSSRDSTPCAVLSTVALRLLKASQQRDTLALIEIGLLHLYFAGLRDTTYSMLGQLILDAPKRDRAATCQAVWAVSVLRACGISVPGHRSAAVAPFVGCCLPVAQTSLDPECPYLSGPTCKEELIHINHCLRQSLGDSWVLNLPEADITPVESEFLGPGIAALVKLARAVVSALQHKSFVRLRTELRPLLSDLAHGKATRLSRVVLLSATELLMLSVAHAGAVTEAYTYSKNGVEYATKMGAFNAAAGFCVCAAGLRLNPHFMRPLDSLNCIFRYHIYGGNRPVLNEASDSLPVTKRLADATNNFVWWIMRALENLSVAASRTKTAAVGTVSIAGVLLVAQAALAASSPSQYSFTGRLSALVINQITQLIREAVHDPTIPPLWRVVPVSSAQNPLDYSASFKVTASIVSSSDVSEAISHHIAMPELLQCLSLIYAVAKSVQGDARGDRFERVAVSGGDAAISLFARVLSTAAPRRGGVCLMSSTPSFPMEESLLPAYVHSRLCEHSLATDLHPALAAGLNDITEQRYCEYACSGQTEEQPEPEEDLMLPPDLDLGMPCLSDSDPGVEDKSVRRPVMEEKERHEHDMVILSAHSEPLAPSHVQPSNARPLVSFIRTIPAAIREVILRVTGQAPPALLVRKELQLSSDLPTSARDMTNPSITTRMKALDQGELPQPAWANSCSFTGLEQLATYPIGPEVSTDAYRFVAPPEPPIIVQQPDPLLQDGSISIALMRRHGQPRLPLLAETDPVTAALLAQYTLYEEAANTFVSVALPSGPGQAPRVPNGPVSAGVGKLRKRINAALCEVCQWAESHILGPWSVLLSPSHGVLPSLEATLAEQRSALLRAGISEDKVNCIIAVMALLHSTSAGVSDDAIRELATELAPEAPSVCAVSLSAAMRQTPTVLTEDPIRLLLHGAFAHFTVESWPSLIHHPAVRVYSPSFSALSRPPLPQNEQPQGFYLLDPDGTLEDVRDTVIGYIQEPASQTVQWMGCCGAQQTSAATQEKLADAVSQSSLYLYCGHGTGQTWMPPQLVNARSSCAAFLMGCSSAAPPLAPGVPTVAEQLLAAGVTAVIGSLTDVTNHDTNRITRCLLQNFDPSDLSVSARQLMMARKQCQLVYLVGAAFTMIAQEQKQPSHNADPPAHGDR